MNIIERVKIDNFIIFDKVDVELGNDVFFITGENRDEVNQDSNGAGKTALCTAIVWCLFEDNLRKGMLKDDVIGTEKSYCEVEVEFSDNDDNRYVITRYRNHPDLGNDVVFKVNGEDVSHQTSKKKTTERIQQELGINENIFYFCSYLSENTDSLVGLAPYKMKGVVSDLIKISDLKDWVSELKSVKKKGGQKIQNLSDKIKSKKEYLVTERDTLDGLKQDLKDYKRNKDKKIQKIKDKIQDKKNDIERFEHSLSDMDDVEKRYEELKNVSDYIENLNEKIKNLETKLEARKSKRKNVRNKLDKIESKVKKYNEYLDNLTNNYTGKCNVCGNLLKDSDEIQDKVSKFQKKLNELEPKKADKKMKLSKLNSNIKTLRAKMLNKKDKRDEKRSEYKEFKEIEKKVQNYKNLKKMKKSAEQDIADYHEEINKINDYSVENKESMIEDKKENIQNLEQDIESFEQEKQQMQNKVDAAEFLIDSVRQIRKNKLNDFIDNFDKVVNKNLNELTGGDFKSRVNEDDNGEFQLRFSNVTDDNQFRGYGTFSTGERRRINKAVVSALGDIVNVGFLIDDEGFSGLDKTGVSGVMDYMIEKNRGKTLLFVGHSSKVKDYMQEYNNLHIIKENGTSEVVVRG